MLFNQYSVDAVLGAVPRKVNYAPEYRTRIQESGFRENHAAVIVPRNPDKPPRLILSEFAVAALLEHPTWFPAVRPAELLNIPLIAHELEPLRLEACFLGAISFVG